VKSAETKFGLLPLFCMFSLRKLFSAVFRDIEPFVVQCVCLLQLFDSFSGDRNNLDRMVLEKFKKPEGLRTLFEHRTLQI